VTEALRALATMSSALVSDALDGLGLRDQALDGGLRPILPGATLAGRAMPIEVAATDEYPDEPYAGEMRAIEALQAGDVAVYAVEPGVRAALFGELFGHAARGRGAVGAIVDGFIRDSRALVAAGVPVFARGFSPLDTRGRAEVRDFGIELVVGGVTVRPGDYVVGDEDGIVVLPQDACGDVIAAIEERQRGEHGAKRDLLEGASVRDVWDKWRVF
jgi:4-hydroxy-4-methyl-2-oxoglutarate aldolase